MSSKGKAPVVKTPEKSKLPLVMSVIALCYVGAMFWIYPLYMEDKYLNMGAAKYHFFQVTSLVFIIAMTICLVIDKSLIILNSNEQFLKRFKEAFGEFSITDKFVISFAVVSILSFAFASDKSMALNGFSGWFMGLISQLIFVAIFYYVSRYWQWSPITVKIAICVGAVVYLIAVLQRFDLDIFNLYNNLLEDGTWFRLYDKDIEKFVSTLGQTTWYSSYAVLILPFGMIWYLKDTDKLFRIASAIFIMLGAASLCTVNSDSAYVAVVLILMVYFWYSLENPVMLKRFLEIVLMILGTFRIIGILQTLFPERMVKLMAGPEQVTDFVNHSGAMLALLITVMAIYGVYVAYMNKHYDRRMDRYNMDLSKLFFLRGLMMWGAVIVIWLVVLLIILTTKHRLPEFLSPLYNVSFFDFDMDWGNHRGFNWRMAAQALKNASFKDMLIGVGPDCFDVAMDRYCSAEVAAYWGGLSLACAHNEFLNMLVTEGILGTVAYIAIFITSFVRLSKVANKEPMALPCMAAIVAYMGHNIFCYQTCLCTPFIFMIMGIGEMIIIHTKRTEKQT